MSTSITLNKRSHWKWFRQPHNTIIPSLYKKYILLLLKINEITLLLQRQFGGKAPAPGDGKKLVCMDSRFNIKPGNCLVFSFGINNEWSFEDDFDKFGCKVSCPFLNSMLMLNEFGWNYFFFSIFHLRCGFTACSLNPLPLKFHCTVWNHSKCPS